jgi:hypothetical protein
MTNIWVVNDEYVSVAGLIGLHLGYISKGFDISNYKVDYLSSGDIHKQAEDFYKKINRYPGNYYYKKMVIDSMPSEIESAIDNIKISIENSTYDSKMDAPIIEWLDKNVERYQYCDDDSEIEVVISKTMAEFTENMLREEYDFDDDEAITDELKIEYTRDKIKLIEEEDKNFALYLFNSIMFKTAKSHIVLGYTLHVFSNPGALPNLDWDRFYLTDADIWMGIHNDPEWLTGFYDISDQEILALWND